ncbi:unnamed protein product [Oreochromis niloticus]|nr:unnamed protein product [Mustela putorius furo]
MDFNIEDFIRAPSPEKFELCRKDDLLSIAAHFDIPVKKYSTKKEIKGIILQRLVELKIFTGSDVCDGNVPSVEQGVQPLKEDVGAMATPPKIQVEPKVPPTLPRFDPVSPDFSGSNGHARLKVRLARLQLEAQEREQTRKAEFDLKLRIRQLEIEAEKEVKLKQLDVEAMRLTQSQSSPSSPVTSHPLHSSGSTCRFDVRKNIALVPTFRETEVDSYFNAFERIATSLEWPKEMWAVLLQCKLMGKAQEVVSSLSIENSMKYDVLKESILRAYELVPEAYRQKFRNHKKSNGQTYVEFAREKAVLFDKWCTASEVKRDFEELRQSQADVNLGMSN